jgi:hypothetical protein
VSLKFADPTIKAQALHPYMHALEDVKINHELWVSEALHLHILHVLRHTEVLEDTSDLEDLNNPEMHAGNYLLLSNAYCSWRWMHCIQTTNVEQLRVGRILPEDDFATAYRRTFDRFAGVYLPTACLTLPYQKALMCGMELQECMAQLHSHNLRQLEMASFHELNEPQLKEDHLVHLTPNMEQFAMFTDQETSLHNWVGCIEDGDIPSTPDDEEAAALNRIDAARVARITFRFV